MINSESITKEDRDMVAAWNLFIKNDEEIKKSDYSEDQLTIHENTPENIIEAYDGDAREALRQNIEEMRNGGCELYKPWEPWFVKMADWVTSGEDAADIIDFVAFQIIGDDYQPVLDRFCAFANTHHEELTKSAC